MGYNNSEGSSESNWTEEQTTLIGGGNVNIDAKNTEVHGAVVANAVRNGDTLTDLGNLNLITDELVVTELHDTDVSESSGINMSVSVSVGSDKKGSPEFSSNSSSLGLTNQGHRKEQTTAGTLGGGSITRRDGSEHELGDTNRDLDQRQVVTLDQQTGGLDATFELDHRVLSKEGLEDIKENFEDTYEHGEDIGRAAHTVATDERASLLSFGSNVHNNSQLTQLKNELVRNPAYQSVLAGLNSKDPEQYQQAMQVVGQLAQDKFGLNPTDIQFYDGGETTSSSLADVDGLTDRKGGTVTAANHAESGNIFIDGGDGASKTDMANTLGHEVLESQMQQGQGGGLFGTPSGEAKESLADALGAQMQDRLNQAAGGNLDSTGGADFSAALASSAGVRAGTERANNVGGAAVENRQLYTDEAKAILNHAPAYAKEHGMSEDDARRELTRQALREIDDKWAGQIAENPAAREAIQQLRVSTPPINDSYVEGGQVDAFVATPDDKANPYINANAARMQEEYGHAGVDNFLTQNALEEGQTLPELTPLDQITESVTGTAADVAKFAGAMAEDPSGTMDKAAAAVSNAVSGCVNAGIDCVMSHNPREGYDGDKAFVDLLQGDRESAIENNNAALAGEALPVIPVVVKAGQSVLSVMDKAVPDGTRTSVDKVSDDKNSDANVANADQSVTLNDNPASGSSNSSVSTSAENIVGGDRELYRRDGRKPDAIFSDGFIPWKPDANVSLQDYVDFNEPSQYVGTSKVPTGATDVNTQTGKPGYLYLINDPGHGIDVNEQYPNNPFSHEQEIAFPGGVEPCNIKGCIPLDGSNRQVGDFVPNPNYKE